MDREQREGSPSSFHGHRGLETSAAVSMWTGKDCGLGGVSLALAPELSTKDGPQEACFHLPLFSSALVTSGQG